MSLGPATALIDVVCGYISLSSKFSLNYIVTLCNEGVIYTKTIFILALRFIQPLGLVVLGSQDMYTDRTLNL